jgi:hypothetical protein
MTAVESVEGLRLDRGITTFTAIDDSVYRRTEEHHTLRRFPRHEVESVVRETGFHVEALADYRSPTVISIYPDGMSSRPTSPHTAP